MTDRMITLRVSEDELLAAKEALRDYQPRLCDLSAHDHSFGFEPESVPFDSKSMHDGWTRIEVAALNAFGIAVRDAASGIDPR